MLSNTVARRSRSSGGDVRSPLSLQLIERRWASYVSSSAHIPPIPNGRTTFRIRPSVERSLTRSVSTEARTRGPPWPTRVERIARSPRLGAASASGRGRSLRHVTSRLVATSARVRPAPAPTAADQDSAAGGGREQIGRWDPAGREDERTDPEREPHAGDAEHEPGQQ